jgi:phosphoserine phosphatase
MQPKIVFFDMDHTLLDLDCDVSWKEFLIDEGIAPVEERQDMERFFLEYQQGCLNEEEFLEFQLRQFRSKTPEEMRPLLERHFEQRAKPRIYSQARAAVRQYRQRNTPVVLLTATNEAIASPLAAHLEFDECWPRDWKSFRDATVARSLGLIVSGRGKSFTLASAAPGVEST